MKYLLIFLSFISIGYSDLTYIYQKDVQGRESKTVWTLNFKEKENTLHIKGDSDNGKTLIITTPERMTQTFTHELLKQNHTYTIEREGQCLHASRTLNGDKTVKEFNIGSHPWIQEFDFSFKPFILSKNSYFKFSIIHPKHLTLHRMVATKQTIEPLEVHGKVYDALRVKVTLAGLKKMFWHSDLWFDPQSGDLLKYMATEGPNTPLRTITLFSKQLH